MSINKGAGAGEMAQQSRVLGALAGDRTLTPESGTLQSSVILALVDPMPSLDSMGTDMYQDIHPDTHEQK